MLKRFASLLGKRGGPQRKHPDSSSTHAVSAALQDQVYQTVKAADALSTAELASRIDTFASAGLRAPVRDLVGYLASTASYNSTVASGTLTALCRVLTASGRLQIYEPRVFDLLVAHREDLDLPELCVAVYESGRHGLRAKHYLTALAGELTDRLSDGSDGRSAAASLDAKAAWSLWVGVLKFGREHRRLLMATMPSLTKSLDDFSVRELSVCTRICKELRMFREFRKFQVDVAKAVGARIRGAEDLDAARAVLADLGLVLSASECYEDTPDSVYSSLIDPTLHLLVKVITADAKTEEGSGSLLSCLDTVGLIDILFTFSTWKKRIPNSILVSYYEALSLIDAALVSRKTDIKYSPNCGLWHVASVAVDKLMQGFEASSVVPSARTTVLGASGQHEDQKFVFENFLIETQKFCRDPFILDRVSVWQVADVLKVFSYRGLYDQTAYKSMSEVVFNHINEFKDFRKIVDLLNIFSDVGHDLGDKKLTQLCSKLVQLLGRGDGGVTADVAGEVLWALAVQKKLRGGIESTEVAKLREKIFGIFSGSTSFRQSRRWKIEQVRQVYKAQLPELFEQEEAVKVDVFSKKKYLEIYVDEKGKDARRQKESGSNILAKGICISSI